MVPQPQMTGKYCAVRMRLGGVWKWLMRVCAAVGAVALLASFTPVDLWWTAAITERIDAPHGDVLILLGAEALEDVIGFESYRRAVYGLRAWRNGGFRQVWISGGPGGNCIPVSIPMKQFLTANGVPDCAVHVETRSKSTRENALFTAALLSSVPGCKVLLAPDFHSFRACRAFHRAGVQVTCIAFPSYLNEINDPITRSGTFIGLCLETVKICSYAAHGWL